MKNIIGAVWNKYLSENLPLDKRLFNVTCAGAICAGILALIGSIFAQAPIMSTFIVACVDITLLLIVKITGLTGKYSFGCMVCIALISFIAFPIMYISGGGINSGMPVYWVLIVVITYYLIRERLYLAIFVLLQIITFITLVFLEYSYPGLVASFKNTKGSYMDIANSVIISSIVLGMITKFQGAIYYKENSKAEEATKAAEEANKTKSLFLANMSHEIRTPMNAILGMIELILREDISENVREKAHNVQSASASLLAIINDILDFSKIESGKMVITPAKYQFTSVMNDVINMISVRLTGKDVELFVDVDPNIPYELIGDQVRLRQILINLLSNAVKFTQKGSIMIKAGYRVRENIAFLIISVIDTGVGIKQENIQKLFKSFERIGDGIGGNIEGTGLGLAICKQLLELMGGSISVNSIYGSGSNFSFILPQKIYDKRPMVHVNNELNRKILIFKNNKYYSQILKDALLQLGNDSIIADNLEEFRSQLINNKFTHIFIGNEIYEPNKDIISGNIKGALLCIIIDYNTPIISYDNAVVIRRPICSMNIAAVLNGDNSNLDYSSTKRREKFIAEGTNVLVVDDNLINLEVIKGLLAYYKIDVTVASGGMEGIDRIRERDFDLVLLDYMMPEVDGIETLKRIRAMEDDYLKKIPVVALTANAVSGAREMFINEGFQDYISKPIDMDKLEYVLMEYLPHTIIEETALSEPEDDREIYIEGIDTLMGIKNCNGNFDNYINILRVVVIEGREKINLIMKYFREKDYERYIIEVHGVKGAMASIGAKELSTTAKMHEFAGKELNYDYIEQNINEFMLQYKTLLESIERSVSALDFEDSDEEKNRERIDSDNINVKLLEILELLEDFDSSSAEEMVREILKFDMESHEREFLEKLFAQIEELEYDNSIKLLKQYLHIA